jgi:succinyl-diaminopimelate desuccinylase
MYQEQILAYFQTHREDLVEDVKTLVRIRSDKGEAAPGAPFGPGPDAALRACLTMAQEKGFATKNYDGYVGTIDFNDQPTQLDMLAHLDVVPVADNWTVCDPFEPVVKDGKLYGRGSSDDKGPAVAALWAMKCVKDLGVQLPKNVRLIVGTDEECGSGDIDYYYNLEKPAPMTFSPDADFPVINIEKGGFHGHITADFAPTEALPRLTKFHSGFKINVVPDTATAVVAGMSAAQAQPVCEALSTTSGLTFTLTEQGSDLQIDCIGVGAHAASPHTGNNALTGLLALAAALPLADCDSTRKVKALSSLFPHGDWNGKAVGVAQSDEISGDLTLSFNLLDVTDAGLDGSFDSRLPICATDENMKQVVIRSCNALGLQVEDTPLKAPHHVPADSPLVQTLLGIYEQYTGQKGKPLAIGGGTYVHHLENGVAFGCVMPGTDTNMHGADEFAVIDELILSAEMFAQAILDLCK